MYHFYATQHAALIPESATAESPTTLFWSHGTRGITPGITRHYPHALAVFQKLPVLTDGYIPTNSPYSALLVSFEPTDTRTSDGRRHLKSRARAAATVGAAEPAGSEQRVGASSMAGSLGEGTWKCHLHEEEDRAMHRLEA